MATAAAQGVIAIGDVVVIGSDRDGPARSAGEFGGLWHSVVRPPVVSGAGVPQAPVLLARALKVPGFKLVPRPPVANPLAFWPTVGIARKTVEVFARPSASRAASPAAARQACCSVTAAQCVVGCDPPSVRLLMPRNLKAFGLAGLLVSVASGRVVHGAPMAADQRCLCRVHEPSHPDESTRSLRLGFWPSEWIAHAQPAHA